MRAHDASATAYPQRGCHRCGGWSGARRSGRRKPSSRSRYRGCGGRCRWGAVERLAERVLGRPRPRSRGSSEPRRRNREGVRAPRASRLVDPAPQAGGSFEVPDHATRHPGLSADPASPGCGHGLYRQGDLRPRWRHHQNPVPRRGAEGPVGVHRRTGVEAAYGTRSKQTLSNLVFGRTVRVEDHGRDRYGRLLGRVCTTGIWTRTQRWSERGLPGYMCGTAMTRSCTGWRRTPGTPSGGLWGLPEGHRGWRLGSGRHYVREAG